MTSSSQWILPISGQTLHFPIQIPLKYPVPALFNLYALILKIQNKRKKMSNYTPTMQIHIKIKIYNAYKITTKPLKIKNSKYSVCSSSLSFSYGFSLSRKLERETSNLSNFSNGIFKRNSEVMMSQNLKISNFPGSTFSKFLGSK